MEYTVYALPFALVSFCKGFYPDVVLIIAVIFFSPLLFRFKIKNLHISHPFLKKGSYEYQSAFRNNYWMLTVCYIIALAGWYNGNENVLQVFYVLAGALYIDALLKDEPLIYTANFLCTNDLFWIKFKNILYNSFVLYLPLFLICGTTNIDSFCRLSFLTLSVILLTYASYLLKYIYSEMLIISLIFLTVLLPLFIVSLIEPLLTILFPVIILLLIFRVHNRISYLFNHDRSKKSV
jgi:hypothetical protein